jgi:acetyl-CoA C-acetyltransferase
MSDAVLLSAVRTPIGRFRGALAGLAAPDLGAVAVCAAVERAGLTPGDVEEVILGNVVSAGVGQAPARQAALNAGLPSSVAALTINKVCGSGLKAVMLASQAIRCGDAEVIVAGGMESMSRAPWLLPRDDTPLGERRLLDSLLNDGLVSARSGRSMGDIADRLAASYGITRADQDAYALESHRRAVAATESGAFADEIVSIDAPSGRGSLSVTRDEGPRADTSLERLSTLRPTFNAAGTVTPGNASMISDGAAALVVVSRNHAERTKRRPLARIVASATAGLDPDDLFIAPVQAIRMVLDRAGVSLRDVSLFEINEAFAAQMLACMRRLDLPLDRVNVHGGAIALGHPIGASGARVLTTLLHALQRRGGRYGVASLCLGGGNAVAMLVECV